MGQSLFRSPFTVQHCCTLARSDSSRFNSHFPCALHVLFAATVEGDANLPLRFLLPNAIWIACSFHWMTRWAQLDSGFEICPFGIWILAPVVRLWQPIDSGQAFFPRGFAKRTTMLPSRCSRGNSAWKIPHSIWISMFQFMVGLGL